MATRTNCPCHETTTRFGLSTCSCGFHLPLPCTETTLAFQMDVTPRAPIVARPRRGVLFESYPCAEKSLFLFFELSTCWDRTNYPRRRCAGVRRACGFQRLTWVWKRFHERALNETSFFVRCFFSLYTKAYKRRWYSDVSVMRFY
jgi:hypothetical protein